MCSLHLVYATRSQNILRFFFFNDTATPEIYTLSLHDALPIFSARPDEAACRRLRCWRRVDMRRKDRKSTRLDSSHVSSSYAAFCLKKKNQRKCICSLEQPLQLCRLLALVCPDD